MYPKIKFKISVKKDIETLKAFTQDAQFDGGENLRGAIFGKYPKLKEYFKENKIQDLKSLSDFIKIKYKKEEDVVKKNLEIYKKNWKEIEKDFFNLANELFDSRYWPKGKYISYPTIWGMFSRFLEDKTFQVPYKYGKKKYVNVVIAHEMLHFIFYEYFNKKYPKYSSDKYDFVVWNTSEIFNEIVQNSPKWVKVFGLKTMGYPMHKDAVKRLSKKFYKTEDIDSGQLIREILKEAENIKMS